MKAGALWCVTILFTLCTQAWGGSIHGRIADEQGRPLAHASVFIESAARGAVADAEGFYRIEGLRSGQYSLAVSMLGYQTVHRSVILQEDADAVEMNFALSEQPVSLGEVVVTANKIPESADAFSGSVTQIDAARMKALSTRERTDLTALAPNLFVGQTGSHLSDLINIRGMFPATPFNATTMVYYDGVPIYGYGMNLVHFADVERIEVLRGPQPLLYGRNALAGVVSIVSVKPTNIPHVSAEMGYGNLGATRMMAAASAPVSTDLFVRASGFYSARDGAYTNTTLRQSAGDAEGYGGTVNVRYFPSANFDATLFTHIEHLDESIWPLAASPAEAFARPYEFEANLESRVRKLNTLAALRLHGRTGDVDAYLTASWQGVSDLDWHYDADFSALDVLGFRERGPSQTSTVELRLESVRPNRILDWRAGLFVSADRNTDDYAAILREMWATSRGIPIWPLEQRTSGTRSTDAYAAFGELTLHVTPALSISAGARIDHEEISVDTETRFYYGETPDPLPMPPFNTTEINRQTRDFDFVSPTAALRYFVNEDISAYIRVARGMHGGGFNSGANERIPYYEPEYTWNYEAGWRARFLENRIRLGLSAFLIDWRRQQLLVIGDLSSPLQTITNAGRTTSRGLELECSAVPWRGLLLSLNAGLLDATIDEYRFSWQVNGRDSLFDYAGNTLPAAPPFSSQAAAMYEFPLHVAGISLQCRFSLDYQYTDPHFVSHVNKYRTTARHLLGAMLGLDFRAITLAFWTKNLLDHRYVATVYEFRGGTQTLLALPRTFGLTVRWQY